MTETRTDEFALVLRAWRNRVSPQEVGFPVGLGRRTPGLRREELATLAGVSVEYLVRLEQGRARHPSPQMLGALARALRLTDGERDHLYRVAGAVVPSTGLVPLHIGPGVQRLIDRLGDVPLAVHSAAWEVLLCNPLWAAMTGDPSALPESGLASAAFPARHNAHAHERNVAWRHFLGPRGVIDFDEQHAEEFSDDLVADLREALGRYPHDAGLATLVARLRSASPDFERRWAQAHVARHRSSRKVANTSVGPIEVDCDVLTVPGSDLRIVVYTAVPGSSDASKLALLAVTGASGPAIPVPGGVDLRS